MNSDLHAPEKAPSGPLVKEILAETRCLLGEGGKLMSAVLSVLILILFSFLHLTLFDLLAAFLDYVVFDLVSTLTWEIIYYLYFVLYYVTFLLLVLPLFLGRMRYLGLYLREPAEAPPLSLMFYYYSSPRRMARAWRIVLMLLLELLLPVGTVAGLSALSLLLYRRVLLSYFDPTAAAALLALCLLAVFLVGVGFLFLFGFVLLSVGVAVGNEGLGVWRCFRLALRAGRRHFGTVTRFTLSSLWRFLLAVASLGIYHILYFSHFYIISYLRLAMALCPKGDPS